MANDRRQEKGVPHVRTRDDRHTGLPRPLPQLRRPPGLLRRPVGDPRPWAARRGNAIRGCGMKAFRQSLTVASFCMHRQGATRRGARRQEPRVFQLPARCAAAALSIAVYVNRAIPSTPRHAPMTSGPAPTCAALPSWLSPEQSKLEAYFLPFGQGRRFSVRGLDNAWLYDPPL